MLSAALQPSQPEASEAETGDAGRRSSVLEQATAAERKAPGAVQQAAVNREELGRASAAVAATAGQECSLYAWQVC